MNPEWKAKWLEALRSGKYQQGRQLLRPTPDSFCCLGVLCDLVDPKRWVNNGVFEAASDDGESSDIELTPDVRYLVGLEHTIPVVRLNQEQTDRLLAIQTENSLPGVEQVRLTLNTASLAVLNDYGFSFAEIADIIEAQL